MRNHSAFNFSCPDALNHFLNLIFKSIFRLFVHKMLRQRAVCSIKETLRGHVGTWQNNASFFTINGHAVIHGHRKAGQHLCQSICKHNGNMVCQIHACPAPFCGNIRVADLLLNDISSELVGVHRDIFCRAASKSRIPVSGIFILGSHKSNGTPGNFRLADAFFCHPFPDFFHCRKESAPHGFHNKQARLF